MLTRQSQRSSRCLSQISMPVRRRSHAFAAIRKTPTTPTPPTAKNTNAAQGKTLAGRAYAAAMPDVECILGPGGDKAIDTAKYIRFLSSTAMLSIPTSLSNDAFCSPQSSLTESPVPSGSTMNFVVSFTPMRIIAGAIMMFKTMEQSGAVDTTQSTARCRDC